jgi:hypothetical protein
VTHVPYIVAAYVIGVGLPLFLSVEVLFRIRSARRRLEAIDPRRRLAAIDPSRRLAAIDPSRDRGRG